MRNNLAQNIGIATFLSGAASGIAIPIVPLALMLGPGVLFGIATMLVLVADRRLSWLQGLIWWLVTTIAWYVSFQVYSWNGAGLMEFGFNPMLISGLVGSVILAAAFSFIRGAFSPRAIAITMGCGAVLALAMSFILSLNAGSGGIDEPVTAPFFLQLAAAFAIWQVGVGLSLVAYWPRSKSR